MFFSSALDFVFHSNLTKNIHIQYISKFIINLFVFLEECRNQKTNRKRIPKRPLLNTNCCLFLGYTRFDISLKA